MSRVTINKINAALAAKGYDVEIVPAKDYFYFHGPDADGLKQQGVYTPRLGDLTVDQWVADFESKREESK